MLYYVEPGLFISDYAPGITLATASNASPLTEPKCVAVFHLAVAVMVTEPGSATIGAAMSVVEIQPSRVGVVAILATAGLLEVQSHDVGCAIKTPGLTVADAMVVPPGIIVGLVSAAVKATTSILNVCVILVKGPVCTLAVTVTNPGTVPAVILTMVPV